MCTVEQPPAKAHLGSIVAWHELCGLILRDVTAIPLRLILVDRLNIFHKFLLILSVTTILGVVALASTISYLLKKSMLENEAGNTASLIKTLIRADTILPDGTDGYEKRTLGDGA